MNQEGKKICINIFSTDYIKTKNKNNFNEKQDYIENFLQAKT